MPGALDLSQPLLGVPGLEGGHAPPAQGAQLQLSLREPGQHLLEVGPGLLVTPEQAQQVPVLDGALRVPEDGRAVQGPFRLRELAGTQQGDPQQGVLTRTPGLPLEKGDDGGVGTGLKSVFGWGMRHGEGFRF